MARRCFYSFHYAADNWRASMVRQIGSLEGNRPATDNEWETIASGPNSSEKIRRWIDGQMEGRSCAIVLIGSDTANRPWINYEIRSAWERGLGLVGINVHGLLNSQQRTTLAGANPFDFVTIPTVSLPFSYVVTRNDPPGFSSQQRYAWIASNISRLVEDAIYNRQTFYR